MTEENRTYIAIDLKSFFASVECVERGLDPLTTNLVVADVSRTEKTICLAVSPSLKAYGIGGRARLFEVMQRLREVNRRRSERRAELARAIPSEEEEGKANNERRYKSPFRRRRESRGRTRNSKFTKIGKLTTLLPLLAWPNTLNTAHVSIRYT